MESSCKKWSSGEKIKKDRIMENIVGILYG